MKLLGLVWFIVFVACSNSRNLYRKRDTTVLFHSNQEPSSPFALALSDGSVTTESNSGAQVAVSPPSSIDSLSFEDHVITNIAVNKTVRLSSSIDFSPNFAKRLVDGNEATYIETATEKYTPYAVVDLGAESYIDEITIISPFELGDVLTFASEQKKVAFTRNISESFLDQVWHASAVVTGNQVTFHTHATGRYVRVQRMGISKLVLSEVIIKGVRLNAREKPYSHCLSGHDGMEVCSHRGICANGKCSCSFFYAGTRCEFSKFHPFHPAFHVFFLVALLVGITTFRSTSRCSLNYVEISKRFWKSKVQTSDSKKNDIEDGPAEKQSLIIRPNNNNSIVHRELDEQIPPFKLHVLFASPLLLVSPHGEDNIVLAPLDVEKECELLNRSLAQAGALRRVRMEVTCATIDEFQSILTLREASVLHISSHCQVDVMALEDLSGAAHLLSVDALGQLLKASKPSLHSTRLVVLNSCHSAGVATAFIGAGFAHVVALKENERVRDNTSIVFTRSFYLALASGHTVGDAFKIAQEAVRHAAGSLQGEASSFVLLPENANHEEVVWPKRYFPNPSGGSTNSNLFHNPCPIPSISKDFVVKANEIWSILLFFQRYSIINIFGPSGCGKTTTAIQLANHVKLRRNENYFSDGVFYVSMEQVSLQDDHFSHELVCAQIADYLLSCMNPRAPSPAAVGGGGGGGTSLPVRRSCSRSSREIHFQKFAMDKPFSLIVLDGLSSSVLNSQPFLECLASLTRTSPKIQVVVVSEIRFVSPLNVVNIPCGPFSDVEMTQLLVRLAQPKLVYNGFNYDDMENLILRISQTEKIQSLQGRPLQLRWLANQINSKASHGETFDFSNI